MNDEEFDKLIDRAVIAVIKRIEGGDDPQRKYDYLTKLDNDTAKSLANFTDAQIDGANESTLLGDMFLSLVPLKIFAIGHAKWSPSKQGKRAEQLTATMISQETHLVPTVLSQATGKEKKKKKEKEEED